MQSLSLVQLLTMSAHMLYAAESDQDETWSDICSRPYTVDKILFTDLAPEDQILVTQILRGTHTRSYWQDELYFGIMLALHNKLLLAAYMAPLLKQVIPKTDCVLTKFKLLPQDNGNGIYVDTEVLFEPKKKPEMCNGILEIILQIERVQRELMISKLISYTATMTPCPTDSPLITLSSFTPFNIIPTE